MFGTGLEVNACRFRTCMVDVCRFLTAITKIDALGKVDRLPYSPGICNQHPQS